MDDEELKKYVIAHVQTMAEAGRYIAWYVNTYPESSVDVNELIYVTSRGFYSR